MRIISLEFRDKGADWKLAEVRFDALNLLVGPTGAGKTRILDALWRLRTLATSSDTSVGEIEWKLRFFHDGNDYEWAGATANSGQRNPVGAHTAAIHRESFTGGGIEIDRGATHFRFNGSELPRLKTTDSSLVLLANETVVGALVVAFIQIQFSKWEQIQPSPMEATELQKLVDGYRVHGGNLHPQVRLVLSMANSQPVQAPLVAYILQQAFPREFQELRARYLEIFPSLRDLRVVVAQHQFMPLAEVGLAIREEGVADWIPQRRISSGMLRTFVHLLEVAVAPPGSVFLIDEFENSLGVNCMSEVVDLITERQGDVQYIMTSHHPYIINRIPIASWKIVQRHGNQVHVVDARSLPAMASASRHEAFARLLNLPEYEDAIS